MPARVLSSRWRVAAQQAGGALAIAVFGALLASRATFLPGLRVSLVIAACVVLGGGHKRADPAFY